MSNEENSNLSAGRSSGTNPSGFVYPAPLQRWQYDSRFRLEVTRRWIQTPGVANLWVDGHFTKVLIDFGCQANLMTERFAREKQFSIGPLSELREKGAEVTVLRGHPSQIVGYVVVGLKVPNAPHVQEYHIVLVIEDQSSFARKIPLVLGGTAGLTLIPPLHENGLISLTQFWEENLLPSSSAAPSAAQQTAEAKCAERN